MSNSFDFERENKLILNFSHTEDRASLLNSHPDSEKEEDEDKGFLTFQRKYKNNKVSQKKFQVKNGQIAFHIAGYPGVQIINISELTHFIPFAKLKAGAKKFLKHSGVKKKRRKKRKLKNINNQYFNDGQRTKKETSFNDDGGATV
jgi:hypothetical protein